MTEPPLHDPNWQHFTRDNPFTNPYRNPLANKSPAPVASVAFDSPIAGTRTTWYVEGSYVTSLLMTHMEILYQNSETLSSTLWSLEFVYCFGQTKHFLDATRNVPVLLKWMKEYKGHKKDKPPKEAKLKTRVQSSKFNLNRQKSLHTKSQREGKILPSRFKTCLSKLHSELLLIQIL